MKRATIFSGVALSIFSAALIAGCSPNSPEADATRVNADKNADSMRSATQMQADQTRAAHNSAAADVRDSSGKTFTGSAQNPTAERKADEIERAGERKADNIERQGENAADKTEANGEARADQIEATR